MATYCISDLHGRYDYFRQVLEAIHFDPESDKLYFLGDAIDRHRGGINIIRYFMNHSNSCFYIMGNHEEFFLKNIEFYDLIMLNEEFRTAVTEIGRHPTLFKELYKDFSLAMSLSHFLASGEVYSWSNKKDTVKRKNLLKALKVFARFDNCDTYKGKAFLIAMFKNFETRHFIEELCILDKTEYDEIKAFLKDLRKQIIITVNSRNIVLTHQIKNGGKGNLPRCDTKSTYYIYGHTPISKIHKMLSARTGFEFDYKRIFSYVDENDNFYYNLDTGDSPLPILCLDDFSEIYMEKIQGNSYSLLRRGTNFDKVVTKAYPFSCSIGQKIYRNNNEQQFAVTTHVGNCYEFLIIINKIENYVLYTRIAWLEEEKPIRCYDKKSIRNKSIEKIYKMVEQTEKRKNI